MTYPQQQQPYVPAPPAARVPKRRRWPWVLGIVGALILGIIIGSAGKGSTPTPAAGPSSTGPVATAPAGSTAQPAAPATEVPAAGPKTSFGDGTYKVGEDIAAGSYKSSGPRAGSAVPLCYWARKKDDSGTVESIIANNSGQGATRLTVKKGEFLEVTGCDFTRA